jgi:hypothetical protein
MAAGCVNNIGAVQQHFRYSPQRASESGARVRALLALEIGILRDGKNFWRKSGPNFLDLP